MRCCFMIWCPLYSKWFVKRKTRVSESERRDVMVRAWLETNYWPRDTGGSGQGNNFFLRAGPLELFPVLCLFAGLGWESHWMLFGCYFFFCAGIRQIWELNLGFHNQSLQSMSYPVLYPTHHYVTLIIELYESVSGNRSSSDLFFNYSHAHSLRYVLAL